MASIVTYNQLLATLQDFANRSWILKGNFGVGLTSELVIGQEQKYPLLWVRPVAATFFKSEAMGSYPVKEIELEFIVIDLEYKERTTPPGINQQENDAHSDCLQVIDDLIKEVAGNPFYVNSDMQIVGDVNALPLTRYKDDITAGWSTNMTFRLMNDGDFCGLPLTSIDNYSFPGPGMSALTYSNPYITCVTLTSCTTFQNYVATYSGSSGGGSPIQNGLNTYTGGTAAAQTVNVSAATLNYLSATTISGATFFSGSTPLNLIILSASNRYWSAGTGQDSLFRNNNTGNSAAGNFSFANGVGNASAGYFASILGGTNNAATGQHSFIGGGNGNFATTNYATIVNGKNNTASGGYYVCIGAGIQNKATGRHALISQGYRNSASTNYAAVITGSFNKASGPFSLIGSGNNNQSTNLFSIVVGGQANQSTSYSSFVGGGSYNYSTNYRTFVGGGMNNSATQKYAVVVGGKGNTASNYGTFVGGGNYNIASGNYSSVLGGQGNIVSNSYSSIIAGTSNNSNAIHSSIIAGFSSIMTSTAVGSVVAGSQITGTSANTFYTHNARLAEMTGSIIYSAGTPLQQIFAAAGSGDVTRVQPGLNTYTGGTGNLPTVNISAATLSTLTVSGASNLGIVSATTFISGSTNLYQIFQKTGVTSTFGVTIDGMGSVITVGQKGYFQVPYAGTITGWSLLSDQSGTCVVDIWKLNNAIPTSGNSITASAKPTLTSAQLSASTAVGTWTSAIAANDVFGYNVNSATGMTRVSLVVDIIKL